MNPLVYDFICQWEKRLGRKLTVIRLNSKEVIDPVDKTKRLQHTPKIKYARK